MPQQLIYTSAPRGLVAGRSGHCTVARSAAVREPVMLRLEQFSYYHHLSLSGGRERPIMACRVVDIRGTRFHVLSRILDAGLDFTGRTNFLAHHLVFTPEELVQMPTPATILRDWPGWLNAWPGEPALLTDEDWTGLAALAGNSALPAQTWQRLTGEAANGYGLLEAKPGTIFRAEALPEATLLSLFAESAELLELRDPRRDFRTAAWLFTFTTSLQEQDNPADFRWRCVHGDSPAFLKLAGPDCLPLTDVRAAACTQEEIAMARGGRRVPLFAVQPQDFRVTEGGAVRFHANAYGVPSPSYQWFTVDRKDNGTPIAGQTGPSLDVPAPPPGTSRYLVRASNSAGEAVSRVALLAVERKIRILRDDSAAKHVVPKARAAVPVRSAEEIEKHRNRLEAERIGEIYVQQQKGKHWLGLVLASLAVIAIACVVVVAPWKQRKLTTPPPPPEPAVSRTNSTASSNHVSPSPQTGLTNNLPAPPAPNLTNANAIGDPTPPAATIRDEPDFGLPTGWTAAVVGSSNTPTSATHTKGTFFLKGSGSGPGAAGDAFFFVRKEVQGWTNFAAYLASDGEAPPGSYFGLMVRASDSATAPFVFVGASSNRIQFIHRSTEGALCITNPPVPRQPRDFPYLKLAYKEKTITASYSWDGSQWTQLGKPSKLEPDQPNYLLGFALWSGTTTPATGVRFETWPRGQQP